MTQAAKNLPQDSSAVAAGVDLRFRVIKEGDLVRLFGAINDTTNLDLLADMRQDSLTLDLAGINAASWTGITKFHRYLTESGMRVHLTGIPRNFYRCLRLLLTDTDPLTIDAAELDVFDPAQVQAPIERMVLSIKDVESLAVEQGPIITVAQNKQILGIAEHICPRYFQAGGAPAPLFLNSWCLKNNDEAIFWYNLGHAITCNLTLGTDLVESTRQNLAPALSSAVSRLQSLQQALLAFDGGAKTSISMGVTDKIAAMDARIRDSLRSCDAMAKQSYSCLRQIQVSCWSKMADNPRDIFAGFKTVGDTIGSLDVGLPDLGELLGNPQLFATHNGHGQQLLKHLRAMPKDERTATKLDALREMFHVLDIISEGDWDASVDIIQDELTSLQANSEVILGLLDQLATGQLLIERWLQLMAEVMAALEDIRLGKKDWNALRTALFVRWQSEALPVEELRTFSFYFPDAFHRAAPAADGSDGSDGGAFEDSDSSFSEERMDADP